MVPAEKTLTTMSRLQKNWIIQMSNRAVLLVIVASLIFLIVYWQKLPPQIPLWYSLPWGIDQLASPYWLFLLPLSSALFFGINSALSIYVFAEYLIFVQLSFLTSLLVSILSFITLMKILTIAT